MTTGIQKHQTVAHCVKTAKFMDIQWSDCPVEIEEIVKKMWSAYELGNDYCFLKFTSFNDLKEKIDEEEDFKTFIEYCRSQGIKDNELCVIHWWW